MCMYFVLQSAPTSLEEVAKGLKENEAELKEKIGKYNELTQKYDHATEVQCSVCIHVYMYVYMYMYTNIVCEGAQEKGLTGSDSQNWNL